MIRCGVVALWRKDESMCLSCLPFTAPPHQSHTGRRSTSRRRVAASVSWAWRPTLPTSHSAVSSSGGRCCNSLRRRAPSHFSGNFSSCIYHLLFTIYHLTIYHLPFTVFVIVYYYAKLQKIHELCKKILYKFRPKIVKDCQRLPMSATVCQRLSTAHQFFVPLHRVRKRKSTSWKSGVNTLRNFIRHFAQARRANERENDL